MAQMTPRQHADPWTSERDAIELANKLDIRFTRDPDKHFETDDGKLLIYSAWSPDDAYSQHAETICEAICVVADLMISELGEKKMMPREAWNPAKWIKEKDREITILKQALERYANPANWEPNTPELNAHEVKGGWAEDALERCI